MRGTGLLWTDQCTTYPISVLCGTRLGAAPHTYGSAPHTCGLTVR